MRAAYTVIQRVKGGDAGGDAGEAVGRGPGEDKEAEVDSEIEVDSKLDQLIDDDEDWEGGGERTLSRQHQRQVSVVSAFPWQWCANKLVSLDEAKAKTSLRENDGQSAGQGS